MSIITAQCGKHLNTVNDHVYFCKDCGEAVCENHIASRRGDNINVYCLACVDSVNNSYEWGSGEKINIEAFEVADEALRGADDVLISQNGEYIYVELAEDSIYDPIIEPRKYSKWQTKLRSIRYRPCIAGCCIL